MYGCLPCSRSWRRARRSFRATCGRVRIPWSVSRRDPDAYRVGPAGLPALAQGCSSPSVPTVYMMAACPGRTLVPTSGYPILQFCSLRASARAEAGVLRPGDRFGTAGDVEFGEDVRDVVTHGLLRYDAAASPRSSRAGGPQATHDGAYIVHSGLEAAARRPVGALELAGGDDRDDAGLGRRRRGPAGRRPAAHRASNPPAPCGESTAARMAYGVSAASQDKRYRSVVEHPDSRTVNAHS